MKRLFIIVSVWLCTSYAYAGVLVVVESKDPEGGNVEVQRISVDGNKVSMNRNADSGKTQADMIFRGDRKLIWAFDHGRSQYTEMNQNTVKEIGAHMEKAMQRMEEQMQNMPPQQREMMRRMMQSMKSGMGGRASVEKSRLEKTSETDTINGYPCVKYIVYQGTEKRREFWVTEAKNISSGAMVSKAFAQMGNFFAQLMDSANNFPMMAVLDNPYSYFKQIEGFPVVTLEYKNGKLVRETRLKSVEEKQLAASTFEPPAGYTKRDPYPS